MSKNVLFVFDKTSRFSQKRWHGLKDAKVFLCPLEVDEEFIAVFKSSIESLTRQSAEVLPYVKIFNEKAFQEKEPFIQFISDFIRKPLIDNKSLNGCFLSKDNQFSYMEASLVAEKNTVRSHAYGHLVAVLSILELSKHHHCNEIWMDIDNSTIAQSVVENCVGHIMGVNFRNKIDIADPVYHILHGLKSFWRIILLGLRMINAQIGPKKSLLEKKSDLSKIQYVLTASFPQINENALKDKKFINRYYGTLQSEMKEKYGEQFCWLMIPITAGEINFTRMLKMIKEIKFWSGNFYFLDDFLAIKDFKNVLMEYFRVAAKFFKMAAAIKKEFLYGEEKLKIWQIFRREWCSSLCGVHLLDVAVYRHSFKNFFNLLPARTRILYMAEIHGWEKALNVSAHQFDDIKTIGIQHSIVSPLLLFYFNGLTDQNHSERLQTVSMPDYLGCVGAIPLQLLKEGGLEAKKLFVLGPLRFSQFEENLNNLTPWTKKKNQIVVALSISPRESLKILEYVYYAYKDSEGISVVIKEHPFCPVEPLLKSFDVPFSESVFHFSKEPLGVFLKESKILIVAESSSALDALSYGCKVIVPCFPDIIDMNPLSKISHLGVHVYTPHELAAISNNILSQTQAQVDGYENDCRTFIGEYCCFLNKGERYLERLEAVLSEAEQLVR